MIKKEKKIFCKISLSYPINEIKLNPNHLDILLVGTIRDIKLFTIEQTSEENPIIKPNYVFNKNTASFNSACFNPLNSHIIASSFNDFSIQIWSINKPFIHTIKCELIPTQIKWHENGNLLGFIDDTKIKIYHGPQKRIIFNLDLKESEINFEFYKDGIIFVLLKDKDQILEYEFCMEPEINFISEENAKYKNIYEFKYNFFLVYENYYIINSNKNKIILYDKDNKEIFEQDYTLNRPKIIKSSKEDIIFKILDKDKDNNFKIIVLKYNQYKIDKGQELFENSFKI